MAKKELMYQCELAQGSLRDIAFIEEHGAKVGATVELLDVRTGEDSLWEVLSVSDTGIEQKHLKDLQDKGRGWKKKTDA